MTVVCYDEVDEAVRWLCESRFGNRWFSPSLDSSLLYLFLLAYLRLVLFRDQWCFDVGKGKRVEYNGARRGLVLANKEHCRTVLSTMERDVALFRRTKNTVEPRFGVQGRG